jgi:hypothetical protein
MTLRMSQVATVLAELSYPAVKWQIVAEADHYGPPQSIRAALWSLPADRRYDGFDDIREALLSRLRARARASRVSRPGIARPHSLDRRPQSR